MAQIELSAQLQGTSTASAGVGVRISLSATLYGEAASMRQNPPAPPQNSKPESK